eukprot:1161657-Pelagomonas_calceolata.AAC.4
MLLSQEYIGTFFDVVEHELTSEERKSLLLFWTGLANLPLGGFSSLPSKPQLWCANEGAGATHSQTCSGHCLHSSAPVPVGSCVCLKMKKAEQE